MTKESLHALASDDPMSPRQPIALRRHQQRALFALLVTISFSAPMVTLGLYFKQGMSALTWVGVFISLSMAFLLLSFRLGHHRLTAQMLIFGLIITSAGGVVAHGSVRSGAMFMMLGAVVGAGAFLSRRALIAAGVLCVGLVGALNWLDYAGMLPEASLQPGWTVFLTQAVVLVSMLVSVSYGRYHLSHAFHSQEIALERARDVEANLRASEVQFRALFQNNPVACVVQSVRHQRVLDANDAFQAMFGYSRDELTVEDRPNFWENRHDELKFQAMLEATRRVSGMRTKAVRRDGSVFDSVIYAEVVPHGPDHLLIAMVLDVTAEAQARRELESSQERFAKAFNFSPLGMTITRLSDGRFMEVNPANERVLGYTQEDFEGKTSVDAGVWLTEEERGDYIQALKRDGRLSGYETRMRSRAGKAVDVKVWAEIIELDGERCALSFTLNVEEEKRRETTLKNVAEGVAAQTGEAFFLSLAEHLASAIGAQGVVVAELSGEHRIQTLAWLKNGQLQPNIELSVEHTQYARILASKDIQVIDASNRQVLLPIPPFDPDEIQSSVGIALTDADGTPIGVLGAVWQRRDAASKDVMAMMRIFASRCSAELVRLLRDREISKLHDTLEQRVQQRTEQLEYLNRELDAFAYTVSHDLKSPLRAMDGFMQVLREQMHSRIDADDAAVLDRIDGSVGRMNSLITDLLALARVSQGQLQRMDVDLTDLAQAVIRQEQHRDPAREVAISVEPGMTANCDARMAHIVLENLIGNAWKYSRKQDHACIEVGQVVSAGGAPEFFVRDNGAGFDMARADRLFKPFTRLHSASEFEGSGIGLATVRRIIERHGGQIRAESSPGEGASFWFSFGQPESE
ncbi:PAS domain S-box protein [Hydrogenophaga sp. 5NK40-0174]|uniref:PAS domain-containing sensor histidine kinase n=1 Tax=Hydrogenophaga sp. 5NK40-0174 TaxID=3127649 RepID=UPI0031040B5D